MEFALEILAIGKKNDNESNFLKRDVDDGGCYVF